MLTPILAEINQENGSNYKLSVLKKHKDNQLLQCVLKMCYDKVVYTYGVKKLWPVEKAEGRVSLDYFLTFLESQIVSRTLTGRCQQFKNIYVRCLF